MNNQQAITFVRNMKRLGKWTYTKIFITIMNNQQTINDNDVIDKN